MHYFCPSCWNQINEKDTICPHCHASITALDNESFTEKLQRALKHFDLQTVRRAIFILGEKHLPESLPYLMEIPTQTSDPYILKELILALCKYKQSHIKELILPFTGAEYPAMVRFAAIQCLEKWKDETNL